MSEESPTQTKSISELLQGMKDPAKKPVGKQIIQESVDKSTAKEIKPKLNTNIELHDGEELSDEFAQIICQSSQTRLIVLAGDSESGKTTLLSALYEKFLRGNLLDYSFAGSKTLLGFEKRSWRARIVSNAQEADTERTRSGEQNLLHLLLCRKVDNIKTFQNILLLDISGEDYREARVSREACLKLQKLKRADHLAMLIDGEKILDVMQRHEAVRNSKQLLQRILDTNMLPARPNIYILVTKYDKIKPVESELTVRDFLQNVEQSFQDTFASKVGSFQFCKIASRPKSPSPLELGYGFDIFFPQWVEDTPFIASVASIPATYEVSPIREFDKYLRRQVPLI
jgi:hypothetical protein